MALSQAGTLLTMAQQRAQLGIRSMALRDLVILFPTWRLEQVEGGIWDIDLLDQTWEPFMVGLLGVLEKHHTLSARQAGAYYATLRMLEGAGGSITPTLAEFDRERAIRNLTLLGPIFTKKQIAARRPGVRETALARLSGAVTALVVEGQRATVVATQANDVAARGFHRVITGTCQFCRDLAAKGASVGEFQAHSNCACVAEPAFGDIPDAPRKAEALKEFDRQYDDALGDEGRALRIMSERRTDTIPLNPSEQGANGLVSKVTTVGRRGSQVLIEKEFRTSLLDAQTQMDKEILTSKLGRKIGAPVPHVAAITDRKLVQEFVDIPTNKALLAAQDIDDAGRAIEARAVRAKGSRELGLLDWLTGNQDRHQGNWFYDEVADQVVGIDHGVTFLTDSNGFWRKPWSPFADAVIEVVDHSSADRFTKGYVAGAKTTAFTQAELAQVETVVRGLRNDFELYDRLDWHNQILERLHMLQEGSI